MARRTREIWRNLIGQLDRSGKTQEQFAAEREIPLTTLRSWIYRLRREQEEEGASILPVRVVSSPSPAARRSDDEAATVEVMLLRFASGASSDFIADVVARLRRASVRIFLATGAVDLRKSIDGLGALAGARGHDLFSGHLFVFTSRRGDRIDAGVSTRFCTSPMVAPVWCVGGVPARRARR